MKDLFVTEYDSHGCLRSLINPLDPYQMDWVQKGSLWGEAKLPQGISVRREHWITEKGTLRESFCFTNETRFPIYFTETDLGIYVAYPDNYTDAWECMVRRCHTHVWCGGEASWIMALRMNGAGPHLGLMLREGSIGSYSIRRKEERSSNDRGEFLLHPELDCLFPGESYVLSWELFWFQEREAFKKTLEGSWEKPIVCLDQATFFPGESAQIQILYDKKPSEIRVTCEGESLSWTMEEREKGICIHVEKKLEQPGDHRVDIFVDGISTYARIFCCTELMELMDARCRFIAKNQQETRGCLRGAYLIYDRETKRRYYSHLDDHNGGRERVGMGALLALYLQDKQDPFLEESLDRYISYVYRELFCRENGDVYNDVNKNLEWDRLYNYPWMAVFFMELYKAKKEKMFLEDACRAMLRYYEKGGERFYGIGIPASELAGLLEMAGMEKMRQVFLERFIRHGEYVMDTGLYFPKSEVNYEQSIVAPAVSILLQAYELSGRKDFLETGEKMLGILGLFHGHQPDYHLYENAIRHWDGYWFGKRRLLGDTFPHYWSTLTGVEFIRYGRLTGNQEYLKKGRSSLRGALNLFREDGSAACAMVYPAAVNQMPGHYYDPWANDQDWALYFAWKMKKEWQTNKFPQPGAITVASDPKSPC